MAGILFSKERMMDTILTTLGRRHLVDGRLELKYYSFSDIGISYDLDAVSGSADSTQRIYLEASNSPTDQLTFESDESGKLLPFTTQNAYSILAGKILSSSLGSYLTVVEDSRFSDLANSVLSSSLENFSKLYSIGSFNQIFDEPDFVIGNKNILFQITDQKPIFNETDKTISVNAAEKFVEDIRLSSLPNYQYLPPINKTSKPITDEIIRNNKLGNYVPLAWKNPLTLDAVENQMDRLDKAGCVKIIDFFNTSKNNHIISQMFEINTKEIIKLDVIDFGQFTTQDLNHPTKHVFFLGKIITNDVGANAFINIFTIILE